MSMRSRSLFHSCIVSICAAGVVSGCFEGSSSDSEERVSRVTGVPAKGWAECDVIVRRPDGSPLTDFDYKDLSVPIGSNEATGIAADPIASADVRYDFDLGSYTGVAVIEATDCSYEDELTGRHVDDVTMTSAFVISQPWTCFGKVESLV